MKFVKMLVAFAVVAVFGVTQAHATIMTVTQTQSYGPTATDWSNTVTFNQANDPGCTLLSVEVINTSAVDQSGTITNQNTNTVHVSISTGALTETSGPGVYDDFLSPATPFISQTLAHNQSYSFGPVHPTQTSDTIYTAAADLAYYIGTGTFNVTTSTTSFATIAGASNMSLVLHTDVTQTTTIIYTFDCPPVSSPEIDANVVFSALSLLVGCVAVFFGRRKAAFVA